MRAISIQRHADDNALLSACDELHTGIIKACAIAFASGGAVGCVWFLCVAYRAGVFPWFS